MFESLCRPPRLVVRTVVSLECGRGYDKRDRLVRGLLVTVVCLGTTEIDGIARGSVINEKCMRPFG